MQMTGEPEKVYRNKWEENPDFHMKYDVGDHSVVVTFSGETIAESSGAKFLLEADRTPVLYVPVADVRQDLLERTDTHSHCHWKGHCSYYSIKAGGKLSENALWAYEDPYPEAGFMKGYVSFHPDRVDEIKQS
ncbi:MAG: DUF427 domain-containing protein [Alphaproteobacteria bacterium]|jgi:uncharacterized protein (DUF427 family)